MLTKLSFAHSPSLSSSSSSTSCLLGFTDSIAWKNSLPPPSASWSGRRTSRSDRSRSCGRIRCDVSKLSAEQSVLSKTKTVTDVRALVKVKPKAGGMFAHLDQAGIWGIISDKWDDFRDRTMRIELVSTELDPSKHTCMT